MSHVKDRKPEPAPEGNKFVGYRTSQDGCLVYVGGILLPITATAKRVSPLGFEWGYGGSGPHALANAILAYELTAMLGKEGAEQVADDLDGAFKSAIIAGLPRINDGPGDVPQWELLGVDVRRWLVDHVKEHYAGILGDTHPAWHVVELDDIWNQ